MTGRNAVASLVIGLAVGGASCSGAAPEARPGTAAATGFGRIELQQRAAAPRLTLVVREGDPFPALAVAIATGQGAAATVALGSVLEARLVAAGLAVRAYFDRAALHLELPAEAPAASLGALATALREPIRAAELVGLGRRLEALARLPLPSDELAPYAACTGQLALPPNERESTKQPPLDAVEATRAGLSLDALSLAAVGPRAFGAEVARALEATRGWPAGARPFRAPPPGASDAPRAYNPPTLERGVVLLHGSVRVRSGERAANAARRLGARGSALAGRLGAGWEVVEIVGAAQPWGGCLAVSLRGPTSEAALAAAITDEELRAELAELPPASFSSRLVLEATHPAEAARRAAWWSLATGGREGTAAPVDGARPSWVIGAARGEDKGFAAALGEALRREKALEARARVEAGQAEMWLLLGSPCGMQREAARAAGTTALALLASVPASLDDVELEPWLSPHGLGVVAHAPPRPGEDTRSLALRVGAAAGRALYAATLDARSLEDGRAKALAVTERLWSGEAALGAALVEELAPDAPARLLPLPSFDALAKNDLASARGALAELRALPARAAVLANVDDAQARDAVDAARRYLPPLTATPCRAVARAPRAGSVAASPRSKSVGALLLGVPLGGGLELGPAPAAVAEWLSADGGALAKRAAADGASAEVRWLAGETQGALVLSLRAPTADLAKAAVGAREALAQALKAPSGAELDAAFARAALAWSSARTDPRTRLLDAFVGPSGTSKPADWAAYLRGASDAARWVTVEPR